MSASEFAEPRLTKATVKQYMEAAPRAMFILGEDGRIVHANARTERLFGYTRKQLLGRQLDWVLSRSQRRHSGKQWAGDKVHPRSHSICGALEVAARRRDGTKFPVEMSLRLLEIDGERLVAAAIRKVKDKPADELNLAALIEASEDAVIGKTLDGIIVSWNKGAEKIYGYKAEEIIGHSINTLIPPGRPSELPAIMKQLKHGHPIESFETTRLHKDGHRIDVSVTISPVKNNHGKVVGACIVGRDITRHKQVTEALRLSEERFRVALKNAPVIVFSQDLQLRYTWMNTPVLAWDHRDYIGLTDAEIIGGEEGARWTAIKEEVLRTGVGSHSEVTLTFEGIQHCFDLVVEPLRDSRGTPFGVISSAIDTTSWKNTIAALENALTQVQQLSGLLPICASCKKIAADERTWVPLESYIQNHSEAKFTHGVCPDCLRKLYPDYYAEPS